MHMLANSAAQSTAVSALHAAAVLPSLLGVSTQFINSYSTAATWSEVLVTKAKGQLKRLGRQRCSPNGPLEAGSISPELAVPSHIQRPPYAQPDAKKSSMGISKQPEVQDEQGQACMRAAGRLAAEALQLAGSMIQPGITTDLLNVTIHQFITSRNAYPSPLGYHGFPKSICTSLNEVVCHGIPDGRALQEGDIVNVDVTVYLNGYHGDTNATFFVGEPCAEAAELVAVTRQSLEAAIQLCGPDVPFRAIGHAIHSIADAAGLSVVRDFVGHGIGRVFHAAPAVLHHRNWRPGSMCVGQTFTIEPILTLGTCKHKCWADGWTVVTSDGSLTAQFEHTLLVTESGVDVLTQLPNSETVAVGAISTTVT